MSSARLGTFSSAEWKALREDAKTYALHGSVKAAAEHGVDIKNTKSGYGLSVAYNTVKLLRGGNSARTRVTIDKETGKRSGVVLDKKGRAITTSDKSRSNVKTSPLSSKERYYARHNERANVTNRWKTKSPSSKTTGRKTTKTPSKSNSNSTGNRRSNSTGNRRRNSTGTRRRNSPVGNRNRGRKRKTLQRKR